MEIKQVWLARAVFVTFVVICFGIAGYAVYLGKTTAAEYPLVHFYSRGEVALVPAETRVEPINPEILETSVDSCRILPGGKMTWLAEITWRVGGTPEVLVKYSFDGRDNGYPCPNGAMFFVDKGYFWTANARYEERRVVTEKRRTLLQALAEGRYPDRK